MIDALRDILDPRLIALLIVAFGAWKALAFFYVGLQPLRDLQADVSRLLDTNAGVIWGSENFSDAERERAHRELREVAARVENVAIRIPMYRRLANVGQVPTIDELSHARGYLTGFGNSCLVRVEPTTLLQWDAELRNALRLPLRRRDT